MTTPTPPVRYLTAEHSICTAGRMQYMMHADYSAAETALELGALGYVYECHLLLDSASPGAEPIVYPSPTDRLAAAEAEVARLTAALAEAHTDCHALAAGVLIAQGMHDDAEEHGLHATGEEVDGAIGRAVWRAGVVTTSATVQRQGPPAEGLPPLVVVDGGGGGR